MGEELEASREVLLHSVRPQSVCIGRVPSSEVSNSNQSALVAFTIPEGWQPGAGVSIVATHVDSPNLRV